MYDPLLAFPSPTIYLNISGSIILAFAVYVTWLLQISFNTPYVGILLIENVKSSLSKYDPDKSISTDCPTKTLTFWLEPIGGDIIFTVDNIFDNEFILEKGQRLC